MLWKISRHYWFFFVEKLLKYKLVQHMILHTYAFKVLLTFFADNIIQLPSSYLKQIIQVDKILQKLLQDVFICMQTDLIRYSICNFLSHIMQYWDIYIYNMSNIIKHCFQTPKSHSIKDLSLSISLCSFAFQVKWRN